MFKDDISQIGLKEGEKKNIAIDIGTITKSLGRYYLQAMLLNSYNQMVGYSIKPIVISTSTLSLFLNTDRDLYKPKEPIEITGIISNRGDVPENNLEISLLKDDIPISTKTISIGANATYLFKETIFSTMPFFLKLRAKDMEVVKKVKVEKPNIEVKVDPSNIWTSTNTQGINVSISNNGYREASLSYRLMTDDIGMRELFSGTTTIKAISSANFNFKFNVFDSGGIYFILTGDVDGTYTGYISRSGIVSKIEAKMEEINVSTKTFTCWITFKNKGPFRENVDWRLEDSYNRLFGSGTIAILPYSTQTQELKVPHSFSISTIVEHDKIQSVYLKTSWANTSIVSFSYFKGLGNVWKGIEGYPTLAGRGTQTFTFPVINPTIEEINVNYKIKIGSNFIEKDVTIPPFGSKTISVDFNIIDDTEIKSTISIPSIPMVMVKPHELSTPWIIEFGEKVDVSINPEMIYPKGFIEIPFVLENRGKLDSNFDLGFFLKRNGTKGLKNSSWCKSFRIEIKGDKKSKIQAQDYKINGDSLSIFNPFLVQAGSKTSGSLVFEVELGEYSLSYEYFRGQGTKTFKVAEYNVARINDLIIDKEKRKIDVFLENIGKGTFSASLKVSLSFFGTETDISLQEGETKTMSFLFPAPSYSGTHTLKVELLFLGALLSKKEIPIAFEERVEIEKINGFLGNWNGMIHASAGDYGTITFRIRNKGDIGQMVKLGFSFLDIVDAQSSLWIKEKEFADVSFSFQIPEDLEGGIYNGYVSLRGKKEVLNIEVGGIEIRNVSANFDKKFYLMGETATLTLSFFTINWWMTTLTVKIRYSGYEDEISFSPSWEGNQIPFSFPVSSFDEKLFYGIYSGKGKAIYLNSMYIREKKEGMSFSFDKDCYNPKDLVKIEIEKEEGVAGTLSWNSMDNYDTQFFSSGVSWKMVEFYIPSILLSGTYYFDYEFNMETQTISGSLPFDVSGIDVKPLRLKLNKEKYKKNDTILGSLTLEANSDIPSILKGWIEDPFGNYTKIFEKDEPLVYGENEITLFSSFTTTYSGMHKLVYGLYLKNLKLKTKNLKLKTKKLGILESNGEELITYGYSSFDVEEETPQTKPLHHIRIELQDTITTHLPFSLCIFLEDKNGSPTSLPSPEIITISLLGTLAINENSTYTMGSFTLYQSPNFGIATITTSLGTYTASKTIFILINHLFGGTITYKNISLYLGTYTEDFYLKIEELNNAPELSLLSGNIGLCYSIEAYGTQSRLLGPFSMFISFSYQKDRLGSITEQSLRLFEFEQGRWVEIESFVNPSSNVIYGTLTHLSLIALAGCIPKESLDNVIVFPNPAHPYKGERKIYFSNLPKGSTIKVFNITGELITRLEEENKKAYWNIRDIASGVYIYLIQDPQGNTRRGKIGVVK
ncbi:MAG: T9SS type A sorting domain-containing protein [bacterium]